MTEKEIKRKLQDDGYFIVDVAKEMAVVFNIKPNSAATMLHEMLAGRRWFPNYAKWLNERFGVVVEKPVWIKSARERMRQAA